MSEVIGRNYDVATDGSDMTELLCEGLLEPTLQKITGTNFRDAYQLDVARREEQLHFVSDEAITISFVARRNCASEAGEQDSIFYEVGIVYSRELSDGEYWPPPMDEDEDDEDLEDDEEEGTLVVRNEDDEEIAVFSSQRCVQEVWQFLIDDRKLQPRKDVRFEYYIGPMFRNLISVNDNPLQEKMLSEVVQEDVDLSINDAIVSQTYSEHDIQLLEAACNFDFYEIVRLLKFDDDYEDHTDSNL